MFKRRANEILQQKDNLMKELPEEFFSYLHLIIERITGDGDLKHTCSGENVMIHLILCVLI